MVQKISHWLEKKGFQTSDADPCLFISSSAMLFVWVDDIIILGPKRNELIREIQKDFKIKDLGKAQHFLGMKISYGKNGSIRMDQEHYIKALIQKYKMDDSKISTTPLKSTIKLIEATEQEVLEFKKTGLDYRAAIGCLNDLSKCTRPEITYTVGVLSQFLGNPAIEHWKALNKFLRYVVNTKDILLNYSANENFDLIGYSDASWA